MRNGSTVVKYADDSIVIFVVDDLNDGSNALRSQDLLNELFDYYGDNGFEVNRNKSFYMCLGRSEMEDVKNILNSAGFQKVEYLTYLGFMLDDKLQFNEYIDTLASKLNQGIGALFLVEFRIKV
jgi:hypothetical protein